jgi:hypothetical protein
MIFPGMRDFTLKAYTSYAEAILRSGLPAVRVDEYLSAPMKPASFCIFRHDVDRKPANALRLARLENRLGIPATYYFRAKRSTFRPAMMEEIAGLGHEVGYHYESLSDCRGDMDAAIEDFRRNLEEFRKWVPVRTIAMHGRPLMRFDNRDLWRDPGRHSLLKGRFGLLGEVYLDIDYLDVAYINDTGRNWTAGRSNFRDRVESGVSASFSSGEELLGQLERSAYRKIMFQIHPERWSDGATEWFVQLGNDLGINTLKLVFRMVRGALTPC